MAYLWGSLSPERSLPLAEIWQPKSLFFIGEKKKPSTDCGQLFIIVSLRSIRYIREIFRLWAPKPALEPSPELPRLRDTARHSRAGPETHCFASRLPSNASKVLAILLGFSKLRNFLRSINASMKEAKAKRHLPFWIAFRLVLCLAQLISYLVPLRSAACIDRPQEVPQLPEV